MKKHRAAHSVERVAYSKNKNDFLTFLSAISACRASLGAGRRYPCLPRFAWRRQALNAINAFTLIELMLVVIIIGALVAMVMPRLTGRGEQARVSAAKADVQSNIATALKLYELDNGNFPTSDEGFNALLTRPASTTNWNGPYLEKRPLDPWNREYKYKCPGEHRSADYDLYSLGKDGIESADDIKNWE